MPKINLLPKFKDISKVEEMIPKNEEKITFSEKFPEAEEAIQDKEMD